MIRFECDRCGKPIGAHDPNRFIVRLEMFAAAGRVDLDSVQATDPKQSMEQLVRDLAAADPDVIEDQTYRLWRFDLCDRCHQALLKKPLG